MAILVEAEAIAFANDTDSNSPAVWDRVKGRPTLFVLNSHSGEPKLSAGRGVDHLSPVGGVTWTANRPPGGIWIEAVLVDEAGTWYGYYHNEQAAPLCPGSGKVLPRIGAARSTDRGATWEDLGFVIEASPGAVRCSTRNHYFHGGVGDFSVVLDEDNRYAYFFYTQYREPDGVGVSVARMTWASRDAPRGAVDIWQRGVWLPPTAEIPDEEPLPESVVATGWRYPIATPIMPALNSWDDLAGGVDVWWGPSLHWNGVLESWVMLLNRADSNEWRQEGIYVSYNERLDDPEGWSPPEQLLKGGGWYPQVIGLKPGRGTDKEVARAARLFMSGLSSHLIHFFRR